jgi:hypothetical protein
VKSLLKLMLCGTVLGFVIESGSVLVNPSRVANASQTKIFLSDSSLPVSVDGITVKEFQIPVVAGGSDEGPPMCAGPDYKPQRLHAWVRLTAVNERLEPVQVKYRLQATNPFTGEVLGEESIQDTIGGLQYYTPFLTVYLDKMLNSMRQLPDRLNLTMTIETSRSSIAYVLKAPEYIVPGGALASYSDSTIQSATINQSATPRESVGCARLPDDVIIKPIDNLITPKPADNAIIKPVDNLITPKPVDNVIVPKPQVVPLSQPTVVRRNERSQRSDVSPSQILLVPRKELSPTAPQERLIPARPQRSQRNS